MGTTPPTAVFLCLKLTQFRFRLSAASSPVAVQSLSYFYYTKKHRDSYRYFREKRKSYLSVEELEAGIQRFIEQYNLTAHPFKWTYAGIPLAI